MAIVRDQDRGIFVLNHRIPPSKYLGYHKVKIYSEEKDLIGKRIFASNA
jgi:hypothetical protein